MKGVVYALMHFRCIEQPLEQSQELLCLCTVQLQCSCSQESQTASVGKMKASHSTVGDSLLIRSPCWENQIS